ncbi:MAG TPA: hypothetical protein VGF40_04225 [Thermoanaerobaculia bacterium]
MKRREAIRGVFYWRSPERECEPEPDRSTKKTGLALALGLGFAAPDNEISTGAHPFFPLLRSTSFDTAEPLD